MAAALMLAVVFAFIVPCASTGAAACEQPTVQGSVVSPDEATARASATALEFRIGMHEVAHCCGGASSSCATGSGSCSSCWFAMAEERADLASQDCAHLMALRARQGLAKRDPAPDFPPPRLIG
jgi:hypothetical protein